MPHYIVRFIALFLFMNSAFAQTLPPISKPGIICDQPYVLCTTATCEPIPGSTDKALCTCVVKEGLSYGQLTCDMRAPNTVQNEHYLISTFSLDNAAIDKVMTCQGNFQWANCLDKTCTVDPQNTNQALCTCDIVQSSSFVTFGGECITSTCGTTLYSGALPNDNDEGTKAMVKALGLTESPMKSCGQ